MILLNVLVGLILVIDGIISIAFARASRVSLNLFNLSSLKIVYIGHIFRVFRIIIGILIILFNAELPFYFSFLGIYFFIDSFLSILTARAFSSWDDYFRISRILIGVYLAYPLLRI